MVTVVTVVPAQVVSPHGHHAGLMINVGIYGRVCDGKVPCRGVGGLEGGKGCCDGKAVIVKVQKQPKQKQQLLLQLQQQQQSESTRGG